MAMRITIIALAAGLAMMGYANVSTAQDITIEEVVWTMAPGCDPGLTYGVDIFVDARGPSPGDIIISGTVQGCNPDLGPFQTSSITCNNTTEFMGVAMAVDREDVDNMKTVEFTIVPCVSGSQVYNGTGGTGGTGGVAGTGGTGGVAGTGGSGGSGGSATDAEEGGCSCTVQSSKLDYTKIGFSLLLVGVLVGRRLRKRRR